MVRAFTALVLLVLGTPQALASEPVLWSQDPDLVPWETMTTSGDPHRSPAPDRADLQRRRAKARALLDGAGASPEERAVALAELGDLFRDEARLVLAEDAADPWRVPLRTTPAWLQLEFALRHYEEAVSASPGTVDADGRLTLLKAVLLRRLGEDDGFDEVVRVIRSYRGTPYVEMAKLAVGDHHFERGNLEKARTAYRLVRNNRDPELANYARYRLASVHARLGEPVQATSLLEKIVAQPAPGPFHEMLRDASRAALANHRAAEDDVLTLIPWIHGACDAADEACARDVRSSAADTYHARGELRADAWLRTVDATPPVAGSLERRLELAQLMVDEAPSLELLTAVEDACPATGEECRAELAHALSSFYELAGDPDGVWLADYVRLPRLPNRPDVQQLIASIAHQPGSPVDELVAMEALCANDEPRCTATLHRHLRIVWGRLSRLNDAAWLHFVDDSIPVPGPPDAEALAKRLVRSRAPASQMLRELEPLCAQDAICEAELSELLVGYYAAIAEDTEASWLIALKSLPEMPLPQAQRTALRASALAGDDAKAVLTALLDTCPRLDAACFSGARVGAEVFFRAAGQHRDAVVVSNLAVLTSRPVEPAAFEALVTIALDDVAAAPAMLTLDTACTNQGQDCAADARGLLANWYESQNRYADQRAVLRVDAPPDLGLWSRLAPSFMRVARTAPNGTIGVERILQLCPSTSEDCKATLRSALVTWYEAQGRPQDATAAGTN